MMKSDFQTLNMTISKYKNYWDRLAQLEEEGKIGEFFKVYAEYLKESGIYSSARLVLYKMAKRMANARKS